MTTTFFKRPLLLFLITTSFISVQAQNYGNPVQGNLNPQNNTGTNTFAFNQNEAGNNNDVASNGAINYINTDININAPVQQQRNGNFAVNENISRGGNQQPFLPEQSNKSAQKQVKEAYKFPSLTINKPDFAFGTVSKKKSSGSFSSGHRFKNKWQQFQRRHAAKRGKRLKNFVTDSCYGWAKN